MKKTTDFPRVASSVSTNDFCCCCCCCCRFHLGFADPKTLLVLLFDPKSVRDRSRVLHEIDLNDLSLWPRSPQAASPRARPFFPPLLLTSKSVFQPSLVSSLLQCAAQGVPLWFPSCPGLSVCPVWSVPIDRSRLFLPSRQPRSWDGNGVPSLPLPAYPLPPLNSTTRGSANAQLECGWIQKRTTRDLHS